MTAFDAPGPMTIPADFDARIAALVGRPFMIKGDSPEGWDCRGCARWIYRELLGVESETYHDAYDATAVAAGRSRDRAALIGARLAAWRSVPAGTGVLVQLIWMGRSGHMGVMLDRRRFIHADLQTGTTIADLASRACPYRAAGFYLPTYVTEVIDER